LHDQTFCWLLFPVLPKKLHFSCSVLKNQGSKEIFGKGTLGQILALKKRIEYVVLKGGGVVG
jgi:hypothetical protein